jgi:flavorubredoxin
MAIRITDDVYWLNPCYQSEHGQLHNSAYLITNDNGGHVLIDTGSYIDADRIMTEIEELTGGDGVGSIILTHLDLPHAANFREFDGVEIVSSASVPELQGLPAWGAGLRKVVTGEDMSIENCTFRFTPGLLMDRPNSIWVYDVDSEVLFTADGLGHYHEPEHCDVRITSIQSTVTPNAIEKYHRIKLPWLRFVHPDEMATAIREVINEFDPEWVAPIHGNPIHRRVLSKYMVLFEASLENIYTEYDTPGGNNPSLI